MCSVWQARHNETGQDYALKVLHGSVVDDENARLRFFEEGLIQSRVNHPNVVAVKGRIEAHPIHALVMEYIKGDSLDAHIKGFTDGLPLNEVKTIATGVLSGLNAAHRRGIIHRDVKPSNVLLAQDHYSITPKLTDFGIAKVKFGRLRTVTGAPMGTPHFMSPEQLRDSRRVTPLSDIYSFGVSLFYMLTNRYPFDDEDLNKLMIRIVRADHEPPSGFRPGLSADIDRLAERCMATKPTDRYQSCREVLEDILTLDWTEPNRIRKTPAAGARKVQTEDQTLPQRPSQVLISSEFDITPAATDDPAWAQLGSGSHLTLSNISEESDLPDDDDVLFAQAFGRSSRLPKVLGLVVLVAVVAFATKMVLDWQASSGEGEQIELGMEASNDNSAYTEALPTETISEGTSQPAFTEHLGTGEGTATTSDDALAMNDSVSESSDTLGDPTATDSETNNTADGEDPPESETQPEDDDEEEDDDDDDGYRYQPSDRETDSYADAAALTGREAELAAERAWLERNAGVTDPVIPPTQTDNPPTQVEQPEPDPVEAQLTAVQINRGLRTRTSEFRSCYDGSDADPIELRIRIQPSGAVDFASATTPGADQTIVRCLVREVAAIDFEQFEGDAMNIRHEFSRVGP